MKCPLFTTSSIDKGGIIDYKRWECFKEECAWWIKDDEYCCIKSGLLDLGILADVLTDIADKMPHEGQFRKPQG